MLSCYNGQWKYRLAFCNWNISTDFIRFKFQKNCFTLGTKTEIVPISDSEDENPSAKSLEKSSDETENLLKSEIKPILESKNTGSDWSDAESIKTDGKTLADKLLEKKLAFKKKGALKSAESKPATETEPAVDETPKSSAKSVAWVKKISESSIEENSTKSEKNSCEYSDAEILKMLEKI